MIRGDEGEHAEGEQLWQMRYSLLYLLLSAGKVVSTDRTGPTLSTIEAEAEPETEICPCNGPTIKTMQ